MKVFEKQKEGEGWETKTNFVDDFNVVVGYDSDQSCCEEADWYFTDTEPVECSGVPIGGKLDAETLAPYRFDPEWFKEVPSAVSGSYPYLDNGRAVAFRLTADGRPNIYLVLFNAHNGYYSHGFTVKVGGIEVMSDSL